MTENNIPRHSTSRGESGQQDEAKMHRASPTHLRHGGMRNTRNNTFLSPNMSLDRFAHHQQAPSLSHQRPQNERIHVLDDDPFAPIAIDEGFNFGKNSGGESKECSTLGSRSVRKPLVNRFAVPGVLRGEEEMDSPARMTYGSYGISGYTNSPHVGIPGAPSSVPRLDTTLRGDDWSEIEHPQQYPAYHAPPLSHQLGTAPPLDYGPASSNMSLPQMQMQQPHHQLQQQQPQERPQIDRIDSLLSSISQTHPQTSGYEQQQHHPHYRQLSLLGNHDEAFRSSSSALEPITFRPDQTEMNMGNNNFPSMQNQASFFSTSPFSGGGLGDLAFVSRDVSSSFGTIGETGDMMSPQAAMQPRREQQNLPKVASSSNDDEEEDEEGDSRFKPFHEEKWSLRYKELVAFHREHGHSSVPHTYPPNLQLARWVKRQRRQYKLLNEQKPSTMTQERLEMLNLLEFVWDSHDVNWREKLMALDNFRIAHGHCNVPSNYIDKKLATWVKCQRRQYKLYAEGKGSAMCPERIDQLESRGFEWEVRSSGSKNRDQKQPATSIPRSSPPPPAFK